MGKPFKLWIYNRNGESKVIDSTEKEEYLKEGGDWAESPAAFYSMKEHGLNPDDPVEVQIVGEAIKSATEAANTALNLEDMEKKDIASYADMTFGLKLDPKKLTKAVMIDMVRAKLEGTGSDDKPEIN